MQSRQNTLSSREERSSDLRWCHPLIGFAGFLCGIGFWVSHVVVAIGVMAVLLLAWFDAQIDVAWQVVAGLAMMVFGVAVLFAFAGWIARSSR